MKIKADLLRVRSLPYDDKGNKIEPEQQPVQRIFKTESDAGLQGGPTVGKIATDIIYETNVGAMAGAMRNPCFSCKHFDRRAWRQLLARWNDPLTPIAERQELNGVRAALLGTKNAKIQEKHVSQEGDMDVEHALSTLGICHAFTELNSNVLIVYPTATCPETVCGPTQPNGFYVAKDRDSEKMGSAVFDRVMRLATGKPL